MARGALSLAILLSASLLVSATLISETTIDDCSVASAGAPCIDVAFGGPGAYQSQITPQVAPCATLADDSETAILDFRGVSARATNALNTVTQDFPLACPSTLLASHAAAGQYLATSDINVNSDPTNLGKCTCVEAGNCRLRAIQFNSSSGWGYVTTKAVVSELGLASPANFDSDILNVTVVRLNCTGPQESWEWLNATQSSSRVVLLRDGFNNCPNEPLETYLKWAEVLGYMAFLELQPARTGYRGLDYGFNTPNMPCFVLEQNDAIAIVAELNAGGSLVASWGPSFLSADVAEADTPAGLMSLDSTDGSIARDTTAFGFAFPFFSEASAGGRSDIVWAGSVDGRSRAVKINVSDVASATFTVYNDANTVYDNYPASRCPFVDAAFNPYDGTGAFPLGCPVLDASAASFPFALSNSGKERTWAFFTESGTTYAILGYDSGWGCALCYYFGNITDNANLDLWDVTADPPVLVDRIVYSQTQFELTAFAYENGMFYFSDSRNNGNVQSFISVSAAGFSGFDAPSTFTDATVGTDAVVYERRVFQGLVAVNYGKYGSVFYNVNANGIDSKNTTISSGFGTGGAVDLASGALTSCGSQTFIRADGLVAASGSLGGLYEYVDVQAYDIFTSSSSTASSSSTSSSTSSTSSTTSSTSSSTTGTVPSASRAPSASSSPSCFSPDSCKYDCSKPDAPSKVPKPSVNPSKVPAASKVPEPEFFTIELTYESTSAECGANGPDCCDVREWLGDDSVAASFYLCSSDSTTKNRAPEFDSKDGTCTVFLAAQEGSDTGKITQAEFDSAVATLEASFSTLCPTDVKNCDVSTQAGKSFAYVIGSANAKAVSMFLLAVVALASFL